MRKKMRVVAAAAMAVRSAYSSSSLVAAALSFFFLFCFFSFSRALPPFPRLLPGRAMGDSGDSSDEESVLAVAGVPTTLPRGEPPRDGDDAPDAVAVVLHAEEVVVVAVVRAGKVMLQRLGWPG